MPFILRILGPVNDPNPVMTLLDEPAKWVRQFNPAAVNGRGLVDTTTDANQAKRFGSMLEAQQYWVQAYGTRPDGTPNRPLTALSVLIEESPV